MKKNMAHMRINGRHIYLREVCFSDINKDYCNWMNDPHVNQYLESRYQRWTVKKLRAYLKGIKANKDNFFFAILLKDCDKHIGNIKLGPVNRNHKYGEIGIIIGDKDSWGKGFATEAIKLVKDYAFNKLRIHKLIAGIYSKNIGSIMAFRKSGFYIEGARKKHYYYGNGYIDAILLACMRS